MNVFKEISRVAIIGTERQKVVTPPLPQTLTTFFESTKPASPEDELLTRAAVLGTWMAAGIRLPEVADIAPVPIVEAEVLQPMKPKLVRLIQQMIDDSPQVAKEILRAAQQRGLIVPAELLPGLFELAKRDKSLREAVSGIGGKRGATFARMRADWTFILGSATGLNDSAWDGSKQERTAYLRELRTIDCAKARKLVEDCWKGEQAAVRKDFLATFEVGLSAEDEPFLERALEDRSSEVREIAASLLVRLPNSAYVTRMKERAKKCLEVEKKSGLLNRAISAISGSAKTTFLIHAPTELDAAAKRDGLEFPARKHGETDKFIADQRAEMLGRFILGTPLELWTEATELTPAELIVGVEKSHRPASIRNSWKEAAINQRNVEWARAFVMQKLENKDLLHQEPQLIELLPREEQQQLLIQAIKNSAKNFVGNLSQLPAPFSLELTQAISNSLFESISNPKNNYDYQAYQLIKILCEQGAVEHYPATVELAAPHFKDQTYYAENLNKHLTIYELRHTIYQELQS
jgi:hypothetical protein